MTQTDPAGTYVRRIRNTRKRLYAAECLRALRSGDPLPEAGAYGVSYMAAQAVRHQLHELTQED